MDASDGAWDEPIPPIEGFMFDVDGALVLGDRAGRGYDVLPGAREVLGALTDRKVPFVLLTNGTAQKPAEQAAKLRGYGLPVEDWQMLTPSSVAADYLTRRGAKRVLVLGSPGVGYALSEAGLEVLFTGDEGAERVDAVYVGWHPDCGMKDIEAASKAIWAGAELTVASDVPFFATRGGRSIGYSHAIVAAIRSLAPVKKVIVGKPSLIALKFVARRLGVPMRRIAVVGDDPKLETRMARRGGAVGFGVATGLTDLAGWAAQPPAQRPHRALSDVGDLLKLGLIP